ncbi:benzoate/H(+) symporter BenE family transporter [Rhizobium sp. CFBP 8762]|uniref:benzoate/H(+) symporter BenE family transporter n=1 Tax=Rhizobium sp. CFBP 8762 TaxID=2775279 RepID=UPI0017844698|nr:benzoate/H(+) symporter BenE family transporter [Rhizobium sp. CFBP 8762]MBD8555887.1 benzoate/H(+) symporter BenE family transporter [Rhizobium sp. CFBP 8762]
MDGSVQSQTESPGLFQASVFASAGVAAVVGFGGTLALIIAAAQKLEATQTQTASWVTAVCIAIALSSTFLSLRFRMPLITAWSTPGLAVISASTGFGLNEAVGAFVITGAALLLTGMVKPLSALVLKIPAPVASGMLAGVLLNFLVGAAKAAAIDPMLVLPLVAMFFIVRLFNAPLAIIAVLASGVVLAFALGRVSALPMVEISTLELVSPVFDLRVAIGLALPLYLVTMASQNLPGFAVLRAAGYQPPTSACLQVTGLVSLISAPFGAHTSNMAALSAALCTGPDAHPNPKHRWLTGPVYGGMYLVFALFGASLVALFAVLPPVFITVVAGLALMAPFINAMALALSVERERVAATVTFAVTASAISVGGIGSAFWALIAGLLVTAVNTSRKPSS